MCMRSKYVCSFVIRRKRALKISGRRIVVMSKGKNRSFDLPGRPQSLLGTKVKRKCVRLGYVGGQQWK